MNDIGIRISTWMAEAGLTYAKASLKLGCSQTTILRWINGTRVPTGLYRDKLERLLRKHERAKGER